MTKEELVAESHAAVMHHLGIHYAPGCLRLLADDPLELVIVVRNRPECNREWAVYIVHGDDGDDETWVVEHGLVDDSWLVDNYTKIVSPEMVRSTRDARSDASLRHA